MLIPHRYLVTLMGFFATYCGFIYNDFMSISLNIFHSCYDVENAVPNQPIARFSEECVYGFGVDPVWAVASDNLNYINSLKMKISVIIAVVHMTLGVMVKASNTLYFRKYVDFFFEFLPQLTFMLVLFAYMDFLIVYKWLQPWESS
jgi:V-type H+-transporting ATPase subunit a